MLSGIFFQIFSYFQVRALVIYNDQAIRNLCLLNSGKQGVKILQTIINRHDHIHLLLINSLWIIFSHTADITLFEVAEISDTLRIFNGIYQKFLLISVPGIFPMRNLPVSAAVPYSRKTEISAAQNRCQERKSRTFRLRLSNGIGYIRT